METLGGAPQQFRLQAVQVPMPKWGKAAGWTARDDAMLLLGVYWRALLAQGLHSMLLKGCPVQCGVKS